MEHRAAERTTFKGPNRSWAGRVSCTCGWDSPVADHPTEASAVVAVQALWVLHNFEGMEVVEESKTAALRAS